MKTGNSVNQPDLGVQHDNETPLPKKPSLLFIGSIAIGVLTILLLTLNAYHGVAGQ
jgi:hypothetical protein